MLSSPFLDDFSTTPFSTYLPTFKQSNVVEYVPNGGMGKAFAKLYRKINSESMAKNSVIENKDQPLAKDVSEGDTNGFTYSSLYDFTHLKYYTAAVVGLDVLSHSGPAPIYVLNVLEQVGMTIFHGCEIIQDIGYAAYYSSAALGWLSVGALHTVADIAYVGFYSANAVVQLGGYIWDTPLLAGSIVSGLGAYELYSIYKSGGFDNILPSKYVESDVGDNTVVIGSSDAADSTQSLAIVETTTFHYELS